MAIRIQLRHDTSANWELNNPTLREGEFGIETDTLKIKVGPVPVSGDATAWSSITNYVNIVPSDFNNIINGYVEATDIGASGGVVGLNNDKNAIIPGSSIIIEGPTNNAYETTLTVSDPTADRTITLPNAEGTIALTTDIPSTTDGLSEGSTNKYFTDERAQDAAADALAAGTHTNITVTYNDAANSISLAAAPGYVDEQAVDAVAAALAAGTHTNISVSYNDNGNAISLTGAQTYSDENAQDAVGNALGTGLSYNDTTGAISVDTTAIQARVADVSDTEIGYLNGVTSAIQTQIDSKLATSTASSTYAPKASPTFTGTVTVDGDVTIDNNLYVGGTTTTTYSSTVSTRDNLIYLNQALDLLISGATNSGGTVEYEVDENSEIVIGMDVRVTGVTPSDYNISAADGIVIDSVRTSGGKHYFTVTKSVSVSYVSGGTAHLKTEANPDLGFAGGYYSGGYAHAGLFRDASDSGKFKLFQGYTPEPDEAVYIDTSHASFVLAPISVSSIEATSATIGDVSNTELQYLNGVTSAIQTQLDAKAPIANPTFTGTVAGITKTMVGLGNVDNTTDAGKPISTATQTALDLKLDSGTAASTYAPIANPTFTGTVAGVTKSHVGLGNVDNTSDANKPVSTATQTALDLKIDESLFDAKGDLLVGSADNTPAKLSVGTNGYLLTANSSATNGVEWAAAPVSLPTQTDNAGKYLTTDGSTASWASLVVPITTGTATITGNTATTIDTNALSGFTSIEYMVSLKQGSKIRTSKVIVQTDGTSVDMTEFAITETGGTIAGIVISAAVSSTNAVLQVTATDAATTNVTVKFSEIKL